MTSERLTPSRRRVLDAVAEVGADGWPVSVREVMARTGHTSTSTVFAHLLRLERDGLIVRNPRHERGGWKATDGLGELRRELRNLEAGYDRRFAASYKADAIFDALGL